MYSIPYFMSYNHCPSCKTSFNHKNDIKTRNDTMYMDMGLAVVQSLRPAKPRPS